MPDNTILNPGAGGDTFAADEISSVKYPRSKIVLGADGVNDGDVSSANPMPVAGEVTVSGSVAVTGTFYQATQPVSGTFWQATQPVSGTFWQATQPVSAAALPLPSGAATEAKQDTGNTSLASAVTALQIIDNIVQVDDADFTDNTTPGVPVMGVYESTPSAVTDGDLGVAGLTSDRQLKVFDSGVVTAVTGVGDLIDARITACNTGAVVISSALPVGDNNIGNVDLASAIPAGDAVIGRVKLTDGTDVADILDLSNSNPLTVAIVDGSGTQITSFGGGTQYTEGDTDASITGTALMWEDTGDTLRAASAAKPLPVNVVSGGGTGGIAYVDDADFTAATTSGTPIMGVADGAAAVTTGDLGVVGITTDRKLYTYDDTVNTSVGSIWTLIDSISGGGATIASEATLALIETSAATIAGAVTGGQMQVDIASSALPSGASTSANQSTIITSLQLLDDGIATVASAITTKGMAAVGTDGTNARILKTDSSGELQVDVLTLPAVTGTGTFQVQVSGDALTALQLIDDVIFADDAAFTAGTSKVAVIGGRGSRARRTAASADGDATALATDRYGRVQTTGIDLSATAVQVTASGDTALVAAPGAGSRLKILRVEASNSHATVAVTAGLKTAAMNGGSVFGKKYLPALGGQAVWQFPGGHLLCGDNEAFNANLSAGSTTIEMTVYYETVLT